MTEDRSDAAPRLEALGGLVWLHHPGGPPIRLTPDAAQRLSRDLVRAAADASWQQMQGETGAA